MAMAMMNDDDDFEGNEYVEDPDRLEEAKSRAYRREYKEALYQLSVALGRDFDWLNDIKPEHLA